MNPTVYYHHWIGPEEKPVYNNLRVPILLSIATLRAVNSTIPIVVLEDVTSDTTSKDWGHFPDKLNFEVRNIPFFLEKRYAHIKGHRLLSRLFDLHRMVKTDVIYCDSDVFWFANPIPLMHDQSDKFCFDGYNTGFFHYRQTETIEHFFEIFEAYTLGALNNSTIRTLMKTHVGYESWTEVWDEMTATFMMNEHPALFQKIPMTEHMTTKNLAYVNPSDIKMLHCNGLLVANPVCKRLSEREHCRGIMCLIVKEFYQHLLSVFDETEMKMIFTPQELRYYLSRQISLMDAQMIHRLVATQSEDGHFHIQKLCDELFRSKLLV